MIYTLQKWWDGSWIPYGGNYGSLREAELARAAIRTGDASSFRVVMKELP